MDLTQAINQPLAVCLILALVFWFVVTAIDKLFLFIKSVKQETPNDRIAGSNEMLIEVIRQLTVHLQEQTKVLGQIAAEIKSLEVRASDRHEQVLRELDRK